MPTLRKRPAAATRRPLLRLKTKQIGTDSKGWRWVATWKPGKVQRIGRCLTDVWLAKHKGGKQKPLRPYENCGKSGEGRLQLRCPRGIPGPAGAPGGGWSGEGGQGRQPWARFIAWYFCKRPAGCATATFFKKEQGRWLWAVTLAVLNYFARRQKHLIITNSESY